MTCIEASRRRGGLRDRFSLTTRTTSAQPSECWVPTWKRSCRASAANGSYGGRRGGGSRPSRGRLSGVRLRRGFTREPVPYQWYAPPALAKLTSYLQPRDVSTFRSLPSYTDY